MAEEKTEKATPKKQKESRKEGQVPRTQELGGWATMLLVGLALPTMLEHELEAMRDLMVLALTWERDPEPLVALELMGKGLMHVFVVLVVMGSAVMVVGVAGALAQGGFYLATKSVKPSFKKLNPISGFKRIFGPQALWEGAKMLIKSVLVAWLVYGAITTLMPLIGGLVPMDTVLEAVADDALTLIRNISIAGILLAGADYAMQRRRVGKQTRMTKEEVKQEHKQSEGDPMLKGAIRSRQLAASRNRMMADVPSADVVLVNPTHVAVALRYDAERGAPRVVARGAGAIAARIREEATANKVPLVQDVPLARALYRSTQVGQEIPGELFAAVAQVLAFVISRRTAGQRGGQHRSPRTGDELPQVGRTRPRGRRAARPATAA